MEVLNITYPSPLSEIENPLNDNIDVFVDLDDGKSYCVVVCTALNVIELMKKNNKQYQNSGCPMIIVESLQANIIQEAIKEYASGDAYWLKLYHLASELDCKVLDELLKQD